MTKEKECECLVGDRFCATCGEFIGESRSVDASEWFCEECWMWVALGAEL